MQRTHDVVVADGTFRVVLTAKRRVYAALDVHESMLGPLHLAFEVDRSGYLPSHVSPAVLRDSSIVTAGVFDDIGHAVNKAAEGTFHAVSHAASSVASPVVHLAKDAAEHGANILGDIADPFGAAAHVIMKAKLGDINAKQLLKTIGTAANAGVHSAQKIGDTLINASKTVAHVVDVPSRLLGGVPVLGDLVKMASPYELFQQAATALQHGDLKSLEKIAKDRMQMAQSVVSLVPGIGTGVSAAIGAGLGVLDGGGLLDVAQRTAYGAIPIPPGIRQVTDTVLDAVLALIEHPHDLTDVAVQVARDKVPSGIPRDVFDTLVQIVVKRVPIQKVAGGLAEHYMNQYAPSFAGHSLDDVMHGLHIDPSVLGRVAAPVTRIAAPVAQAGRMVQPFHLMRL